MGSQDVLGSEICDWLIVREASVTRLRQAAQSLAVTIPECHLCKNSILTRQLFTEIISIVVGDEIIVWLLFANQIVAIKVHQAQFTIFPVEHCFLSGQIQVQRSLSFQDLPEVFLLC